MNSVANENQFSGQKAQNVPSGTLIDALSGVKTAAQEVKTSPRLEVAWQVSAAQNVAIVDLSGKTADLGLPPLTSPAPVATAAQPKAARA